MYFQSYSHLAAITLLLAAGTSASPVVTTPPPALATAAAATKSATSTICPFFLTTTATFSQFTIGATPPDTYAQVSWSGWSTTPLSYGLTAANHNSSGQAITPPSTLSSSLSWSPINYLNDGNTWGYLQSFRFACISNIEFQAFQPGYCSYTVTSTGFTGADGASGFGPFTFNPNGTALEYGDTQPMKKVVLPAQKAGGGAWYFNEFEGAYQNQLLLDDLVFVWVNPAC